MSPKQDYFKQFVLGILLSQALVNPRWPGIIFVQVTKRAVLLMSLFGLTLATPSSLATCPLCQRLWQPLRYGPCGAEKRVPRVKVLWKLVYLHLHLNVFFGYLFYNTCRHQDYWVYAILVTSLDRSSQPSLIETFASAAPLPDPEYVKITVEGLAVSTQTVKVQALQPSTATQKANTGYMFSVSKTLMPHS